MRSHRRNWLLFVWLALNVSKSFSSQSIIREFGARLKKPVPSSSLPFPNNNNNINAEGKAKKLFPKNVPFPEKKNDTNLDSSPNLHFGKIAKPFWPFSNLTSAFRNLGGHFPPLPDFSPPRNEFKDAAFFFSHVGPNRFEYRAQFHHNNNNNNNEENNNELFRHLERTTVTFPPFPFFHHDFHDFNFPPRIHRNNNDNDNDFPPKISVPVQNNHNNDVEQQQRREQFGIDKYPKIFRFNEERINIQDFERQQKERERQKWRKTEEQLEKERVNRGSLLILHGGIFTVQEPPLFRRSKQHLLRKRRPSRRI